MVSAIGDFQYEEKDFYDYPGGSLAWSQDFDMALEDYGIKGAGVVFLNFFSHPLWLVEAIEKTVLIAEKESQL